jgi:hypothetical protein
MALKVWEKFYPIIIYKEFESRATPDLAAHLNYNLYFSAERFEILCLMHVFYLASNSETQLSPIKVL